MSLIKLEPAQTIEQIYDEKADLARGRITKRFGLQKALAMRQAENASTRYRFESTLERDKMPHITALCDEITDKSLSARARAIINFRRATLLHFIANREIIVEKIRREFVIFRNETTPSIGQILDFIMPEAIKDYIECISPADKEILFGQTDYAVQTSADLFNLVAIYPMERQRKVNLYVLEDMNAFCGQIVGVLSGFGQAEWSDGQQQEKRLKEQLKNYPTGQDNFPDAIKMEPLSEDLRIFLIAQIMRLRMQAIVDPKKVDESNSEANLCQTLLDKYRSEATNMETLETLDQFDQLSSISESIGKRIIGIFTPTKEKFLNNFEFKHQPSRPTAKVYSILKLIADLSKLKPEQCGNDTHFYQELSRILAEDLSRALALIKICINPESEIILDRIISVGTMSIAKLNK